MRTSSKNFLLLLLLPLALMVMGILGFRFLEGLSFFDAFYLTVMTISTVGYGDIYPTNTGSKVFSIVLVIVGVGTFLAIATSLTQILIQRSQNKRRIRSLNMIIRVFFSEVGNELLQLFTRFDPKIITIRQECLLEQACSEADFASLKKKMDRHQYLIDPKLMNLEALSGLLRRKGDILIRQAENPNLIEHESFSEVLWAVIHLRDELITSKGLTTLSGADVEHLSIDAVRAYALTSKSWLANMRHLKREYPYLFSLAIRTNPFHVNPVSDIEPQKN
jgi:hypothetical protein